VLSSGFARRIIGPCFPGSSPFFQLTCRGSCFTNVSAGVLYTFPAVPCLSLPVVFSAFYGLSEDKMPGLYSRNSLSQVCISSFLIFYLLYPLSGSFVCLLSSPSRSGSTSLTVHSWIFFFFLNAFFLTLYPSVCGFLDPHAGTQCFSSKASLVSFLRCFLRSLNA